MSLNIDLQLGIDRAASEYSKQVEKAFVSKLNGIGRDLIDTNGKVEGGSSRFELEYASNLYSIGKVLECLDLGSKDFQEDIETLQKMGVRFTFDNSSSPITSIDEEGHMTWVRISFPKIRVELIQVIGER